MSYRRNVEVTEKMSFWENVFIVKKKKAEDNIQISPGFYTKPKRNIVSKEIQ